MAANAYTVFIIHAPLIVALGYSFKGFSLHPLLKFVMVSLVGVPLCFLVSHYLTRRIPGASKIL